MEEKKNYTPEEVINITINLLGQINVPAMLTQQIAVPISQSINNLQIALEIMKNGAAKQDEPAVKEEDI